jgi:hypothetical protein
VRELSGTARTWHWTAAPPPGLTVTPASGDLTVAAGAKARADVTVSVAPGTAEGSYPVPVTLTSTGQPALPATLGVLVAPHGSWPATVNNAGISPDAKPAAANFDGLGDSYSSDALAAAGARPGGTVTVDGLSYSLPDFPAEEPDNVLAKRQTVTVSGSGRLAFLGAAANGNASGTVTITYTDGASGAARLGFSDWTLGGRGAQPAFGNRTAITTSYRNSLGGDPQQINTYVFATAPITLAAGKQVASLTLPAHGPVGDLHIFAVALGS